MTVPDTYIHGTEPGEQQRLAALNRLTNRAFIEFLDIRPAMQVLEVGSGLGLLAADVASAAANVRVVGLERSSAQIAAAARASTRRLPSSRRFLRKATPASQFMWNRAAAVR